MATVTLRNLTRQYGDGIKAVDGLSLDVADGGFLVLVGRSGCGESTALKMIAGLEDTTDGMACRSAFLVLTPVVATLPQDLGNAARVDGATELKIFRRIVLPLMRPGLASVAILNGVWMWNEFFIPLIVAFKAESQTMPVGIVSFVGTYSTEWGLVFASVVVSTLPIVIAFLLMTRQFVAGLTAGAMKG
ncbi:MAG: ABC transporter permease subunit [Hyphomicrobiales bacterium]|nr:ABC transporter permease subunit [Hyphomicrobiales bacterium]